MQRDVIDDAHKRTREIILANRAKVARLAQRLIENGSISGINRWRDDCPTSSSKAARWPSVAAAIAVVRSAAAHSQSR